MMINQVINEDPRKVRCGSTRQRRDRCPNCERIGYGTPLHACGEIVYACCECDVYWYWCVKKRYRVDLGKV